MACSAGDGRPAVGDVILESIGTGGGTRFNFGDGSPLLGSPLGGLLYLVTAIDPVADWLIGVALDPASLPGPPTDTLITKTYAAAGNYTAFIDSCCRISAGGGHVNNSDGAYRLETLVNVGTGNRSPVSAMPCPEKPCRKYRLPPRRPKCGARFIVMST